MMVYSVCGSEIKVDPIYLVVESGVLTSNLHAKQTPRGKF
jgi:hypothetical protein